MSAMSLHTFLILNLRSAVKSAFYTLFCECKVLLSTDRQLNHTSAQGTLNEATHQKQESLLVLKGGGGVE